MVTILSYFWIGIIIALFLGSIGIGIGYLAKGITWLIMGFMYFLAEWKEDRVGMKVKVEFDELGK